MMPTNRTQSKEISTTQLPQFQTYSGYPSKRSMEPLQQSHQDHMVACCLKWFLLKQSSSTQTLEWSLFRKKLKITCITTFKVLPCCNKWFQAKSIKVKRSLLLAILDMQWVTICVLKGNMNRSKIYRLMGLNWTTKAILTWILNHNIWWRDSLPR